MVPPSPRIKFCKIRKTLKLQLFDPGARLQNPRSKGLNLKILAAKDLLATSYAICAAFIIVLAMIGPDSGSGQGWMSQGRSVDSIIWVLPLRGVRNGGWLRESLIGLRVPAVVNRNAECGRIPCLNLNFSSDARLKVRACLLHFLAGA